MDNEETKVETIEETKAEESPRQDLTKEKLDGLADDLKIIKAKLFALNEKKETESEKPNGKRKLYY